MNESKPIQSRRFRRSKVFLKATLEFPGVSLPVLLRNLSQEGAMVEGDGLPARGSRVLFHRQGLSVPSRVVWSSGNRVGLEFDYPLFPRELLRYVPAPAQKPAPLAVDSRLGFRAPGAGE